MIRGLMYLYLWYGDDPRLTTGIDGRRSCADLPAAPQRCDQTINRLRGRNFNDYWPQPSVVKGENPNFLSESRWKIIIETFVDIIDPRPKHRIHWSNYTTASREIVFKKITKPTAVGHCHSHNISATKSISNMLSLGRRWNIPQ